MVHYLRVLFYWAREYFEASYEKNCFNQCPWFLSNKRLKRMLDSVPMPQCAKK